MKLRSVEAVARALNDAGVPYIVVDGLAVVAHGFGRTTWDVDIVVQLRSPAIQGVFHALESLGYRPRALVPADGLADPQQRTRWITEKGMTVLTFHSDQHRETPIDVFVTEPFDFEEEYRRALVEEIASGVPVRILCLETLLRLKREAGRLQDLADIAELRLLHGDIADA